MTDIEIAQNAKLKKIGEIAESIGLTEDDFEPYGKPVGRPSKFGLSDNDFCVFEIHIGNLS